MPTTVTTPTIADRHRRQSLTTTTTSVTKPSVEGSTVHFPLVVHSPLTMVYYGTKSVFPTSVLTATVVIYDIDTRTPTPFADEKRNPRLHVVSTDLYRHGPLTRHNDHHNQRQAFGTLRHATPCYPQVTHFSHFHISHSCRHTHCHFHTTSTPCWPTVTGIHSQ